MLLALVTSTLLAFVRPGAALADGWSGSVSLTASSSSYTVNTGAPWIHATASPAPQNGYYLAVYDHSGHLFCASDGYNPGCGGWGQADRYSSETYTAYVIDGTPPSTGAPDTGDLASVAISNLGYVSSTFT